MAHDQDPGFRLIACECCGGDGGSFDDANERWIACRACNGDGEIEVEVQPIAMEDLEFGPIYTRLERAVRAHG